ncbi:uncharacterized protein B0H18DRAFT_1046413 [Fomitopsis serialis]|uniref:uncharacterized protein n=1 Tax=Fomitopsis serialis TaxID=139415 RepID=UPI002007C299|nr:uncharacterized protein B0H18DRAFT_1046413 [Neoantrodia serialis]KAH9914225.1 hypothetical protein B0H18DRAFT_1046413 [Neoantrodia serialis]
MAELLRGIPEEAPLAGCIVLTAALSDRTFARLEEADFASVYESKIGVVDTLRECVDVGALEFLYDVRANTAMEEQVSAYPNAFAFVCPGIIDSTMMRSSELGESGKVAQLEQFAQWGITAEGASTHLHIAPDTPSLASKPASGSRGMYRQSTGTRSSARGACPFSDDTFYLLR